MSRKKNRINQNKLPPKKTTSNLDEITKSSSIEELDKLENAIAIQKQKAVMKGLDSDDISDIIKAQSYLEKQSKNNKSPDLKSHLFLPENYGYTGNGFKETLGGTSFEVLQRMGNIPVVYSIVKTRLEQIRNFLSFSKDENKEGYTIKVKTSLFDDDKKTTLSSQDKQKIEYIVNFLEYGGKGGKWDDGDDLNEFVSKIMRDSLVLDQVAFELVRDRKGDLYKHVATDASLIRLLDSSDPRYMEQFKGMDINGFFPKYAQVWNNQIVNSPMTNKPVLYYPWELGYGIRNKTANVRTNGYGVSELEVSMEIVTWILWGMQYNGNFFKNGSNPKGFVNIKNGNMNNSTLNEFRQAWRQMMVGTQNAHKLPIFEGLDLEWIDMHHCLHEESEVFTREGKKQLNQLLGNEKEVFTEIWDGKEFNKAKVFKTQKKQILEVTLNNRLSLKTSPDHKFLVLKNNIPTWVERKDLTLNDYVFVNKKQIDSMKSSLTYKGVLVEEDLFELMGWIIGDGHIGDNLNSKRIIRTFYHPSKELDIIEKHLSICSKYNINVKQYIYKKTKAIADKMIAERKVKSLIGEYPVLTLLDADFFNWFIGLGFTPSRGGKNIPDFIYSFDSKLKCAFLRGFFSADGHASIHGNRVDITISNQNLKEQTRTLLISEGIRCSSFKLKKSNNGFSISEDNVLLIKDRDLFFEKINFIQTYKRERELIRQKSLYKVNEAPIEFVRDLAIKVKEFNKKLKVGDKLNKKDLHDLLNISRGHQKASLSKVVYYAEKIGYKVPEFISEYNLEQVIELTETDEFVDMVDVEMFNNNHQFVANGIIVHNSNKDMEFQAWTEFLIVIFCSVYAIDPSELGFHFKNQADLFGQQGQKERLDHSRKKGLVPLLKFIEKLINKYIVSEIDEKFEFKFTGLSVEDEAAQVALDGDKSKNGFVSHEDMFEKYSGRKFDPKKDTILNQIFQSAQQAKMQGGQGMNDLVDQQQDEQGLGENEFENPFEKYEKSINSNPIMMEAMSYLDNQFKK